MSNLKATIQAAAEVTGTVSTGGGKVDQEFDSTSKNAQSGVAIAGELEKYVVKETGKGLSSNDYTDAEKQKNANNEANIATLILNKADKSTLTDYVKFTDYASADKAGIVQTDIARGIGIVPTDHKLYVNVLTTTDVKDRTGTIGVLTMSLLNHAVRAALTDDKRITDMTEPEKKNARGVIGAEIKPYIIYHANAGGISLFDREDHRISSNVTPMILVVPSSIGADYECCFSFQSGETAPTLTYPGDTIKFVGVDCDESGDFIPTANKNYEVVIKNLTTDGTTPVLVARVGVY